MKVKKDKYINFRQSEAVYEQIGAIQRLLSERLQMDISRAYVVRLIITEGLNALENGVQT